MSSSAAVDLTNTSSDEEDAAAALRSKRRRQVAAAGGGKRLRQGGGGGGGGASSGGGGGPPDVVSLLSSDEEDDGGGAAAPAPDAAPPKWLKLDGTRRVLAEYKAIQGLLESTPGAMGPLRSVEMPSDDDVFTWRLELRGFDDDSEGGRALNADLQELAEQTRGLHSSVIMQVQFPPSYPRAPFFLRVVSPRCVMYTGHVTAGGSICVEALTQTGTEGAWQRTYTFEGIVATVLHNMIDCESVVVRTATGPGGRSGPLRVDLSRGHHYATQKYSQGEASSAFQRTLAHHRTNGW